MKQQIRCIFIIFFLVWLGASETQASILIVSPHPDDDILIAAGITYAATTRSEQVTVVYITNGDFTGTTEGYLRQDEAVDGQVGNLGTSEENLIFLGYPDGHIGELYNNFRDPNSVFTTYFGQSTTYGARGLGGMDYHRYRFGVSATYNSYNLVLDLRDIIATRRPQHIITTADFDKHPDHIATYLAVRDALFAVTAADPSYSPTLEKSLVWSSDPFGGSFSWPNELDPQGYFVEPPGLAMAGVQWNQRLSLDVPLPMQSQDLFANLKYLALQSHASQGGGDNIFLSAFIHKDEVSWAQAVRGGNRPPRVDAGTDQAVVQGQNVQLDGSGSSDPDGTALNYQWRQVSGPPVTLVGATTAVPSFLTPSPLAENDVLVFALIVSDGLFQSLPDHVSVSVQDGSTNSNIATLATVTASSQNDGDNQQAVKAVDGVVDGYPGDYTKEWATLGQKAGAWLELNWSTTYRIDRIVLHDRPNSDDQITGATLTFSDGSTVTVGPLTNTGAGVEVPFGPVATSRVRLTVTAVSATTQNIGLAELEIYGVPAAGGNQSPVANAGSDQTVTAGAAVVLDGRASSDPEGDPLSYRWSQTAGQAVTLTNSTSATPGFTAPTGLTENTVLTFSLIVNDGQLDSSADTVNVTVTPGTPTGSNIASLAAVTASSQNTTTSQQAVKAVDGVADGYPGDYTKEWATLGQQAEAWLELNWSTTYQIDRIVLHDRPNSDDQITGAILTFSDGSTVTVGPLTNSGTGLEVRFGPVVTSRVRLTVTATSATTQNIGLAELEVYGVPATGGNSMPVADAGPDQTVTAGAAVVLDGLASSDPDGDALSYRWSQTAGQAVTLTNSTSATPGFTAPTGLTANTLLTFSLTVNDGQLDSSTDSVNVTVTAGTPTASNIASLAAVTASSQNITTSQQAAKAVDGVVDGYPGDYTKEWATLGQKAGAWLELNWSTTYQVDRIVLHDRPNSNDQIIGATLAFSDGSTVTVGPLTNNGAGVEIRFGPVVTSRVRVTVTAASATTQNIGLAELEVYGR